MNAFERQKARIMKKLKLKQLQQAKAFQSQNSQIQEVAEQQQQFNPNHDNSTQYIPDEQGENLTESLNQTDRLRNNLIMIHQTNTIDKVFQFLRDKLFWLKFYSFKQVYMISQNYPPYHSKNASIRTNLIENIFKDQSQQQTKRILFTNLKHNKNQAQLSTNIKTRFFVKYFINNSYAKLSHSFSAIKSFAQSQTVHHKVEREKSQVRFIQNSQKLIKFEKQSRKFRAKSVFVIIRNFVNKKIFQSSFNAISLQHNHQKVQMNQQNTGSMQESKYQSKDARFIKKKIMPHKIIQQHAYKRLPPENNLFNLNHIYFVNHQLKSFQKNHLQFVRRINNFFIKKIMSSFHVFYRIISLHSTQKHHFANQDSKVIQEENSDVEMIQNVMKSICYLSSKIHNKRKSQKDKQKRKHSLLSLNKFIQKTQQQNLSTAFYSIKSYGQYLFVTRTIKKLQQQKKHYLEYFDNSVLQSQENQQY